MTFYHFVTLQFCCTPHATRHKSIFMKIKNLQGHFASKIFGVANDSREFIKLSPWGQCYKTF
jgi:hypothetical protein